MNADVHEEIPPLRLPDAVMPLAREIGEFLDRMARHVGCLERAAADETAAPEVRAAVLAEADMARAAVRMLGGEAP